MFQDAVCVCVCEVVCKYVIVCVFICERGQIPLRQVENLLHPLRGSKDDAPPNSGGAGLPFC